MEPLIAGIVGFVLMHFMSHPSSRFNKKFPFARYKRISFSPYFSFEAKNKIFHFHHWMLFVSILLVSQVIDQAILQSNILHGFLLGGIAQGLMYKDSLKFLHHAKDYHKKIKRSSYHKFSFLRRIVN